MSKNMPKIEVPRKLFIPKECDVANSAWMVQARRASLTRDGVALLAIPDLTNKAFVLR